LVAAAIPIPQEKIAEFCQRHHITKMALFGSVLRDDFGPNSDVDVIVEFDPKNNPGLRYFDIQDELSELFGRDVDLVTFLGLSKYVRKKALDEARTIYVGS
jgi:predicted nucleotidyltransferase